MKTRIFIAEANETRPKEYTIDDIVNEFSPASDQGRTESSWEGLFSPEYIKKVFIEKIRTGSGPGADRITAVKFESDIDAQSEIISRKCIAGTYEFTPYIEQLMSKGKNKFPRVISIPTIRDKIVLKILTTYLHQTFQECLAKDLPNTLIRKIKKQIKGGGAEGYIKLDVANFYGSINHDILFEKVFSRNNPKPFVSLLRRAVRNPTLSANYSSEDRKGKRNEVGVPQGLSISNILAEIYMQSFDLQIGPACDFYNRFVDDILLLCPMDKAEVIWKGIRVGLSDLKLEHSRDKSTTEGHAQSLNEAITFLGYCFDPARITVRGSSYRRFLDSILSRITKFKYEYSEKKDVPPLHRKAAFIHSVNERITGALDGKRRYGWIFFFSEIDDMGLLFQIDRIVHSTLWRIPWLLPDDIAQIKKVSRAFYKAKHSPLDGYIHDYGKYQTVAERREYLLLVGALKNRSDAAYTDDEINLWFEKTKKANLLKLDRDVGMFS